jgi:DNA (cytosine-5)-methyltransferase 1
MIYYNEFDPFAAAWLRSLMKDGLIPEGDVDERNILDVTPGELTRYHQVHLFAGIGGWAAALRLAGWPDDEPVWTASFPCQPFSAAGPGGGFTDERHLWPAGLHLIRECRPVRLFGEQVASGDGLAWDDLVQADLEGEGYARASLDLCAAGFGAPHIRQRLYWMAHSMSAGWPERRAIADGSIAGGGGPVELGNTECSRLAGWQGFRSHNGAEQPPIERTGGFWAGVEWLPCRDGKHRPTQPGLFPLAYGVPNRVGLLRGAGNAIVVPQAAAFIQAYREVMHL